jgi:hypothetical protein
VPFVVTLEDVHHIFFSIALELFKILYIYGQFATNLGNSTEGLTCKVLLQKLARGAYDSNYLKINLEILPSRPKKAFGTRLEYVPLHVPNVHMHVVFLLMLHDLQMVIILRLK